MTDPLSVSASIIAVLQLTGTIVSYLRDVREASEERQRILNEITSASGMLYCLKDLVEREQHADPSLTAARLLCVKGGPLYQFKQALERLASKLTPSTGFREAGKSVLWPFQKREISEILGIIERQKTYFVLALQNKHLYAPSNSTWPRSNCYSELSQALKNDLTSVQDRIKGLVYQISGLQLGCYFPINHFRGPLTQIHIYRHTRPRYFPMAQAS